MNLDMHSSKTVYFVSLGCAKNRVDSEYMLGLLREQGYGIVSDPGEADIAVINTCGFLQAAVEEAIETILEVCAAKGQGRLRKVFVTGCFVQRYGYKLAREIPEVDGWLGTGRIHRLGDLLDDRLEGRTPFFIGRPLHLADHMTPRVRTTPFYTAYLKIGEGCSHRCSYCLIPALTGPFRSRSMESILAEAGKMAEEGVTEVNLVAQDTTLYGKDLGLGSGLEDLLEALIGLRGIRWLRLLYAHPHRISNRLLELLDEKNTLCPYLDIPLQHVNEEILLKMGRHGPGESPWQLLERIRARTSGLVLRTSLIVGFPGETEEAFEELCEFVRWAAFDHLGTFLFSPEKGTPAARMDGRVPPEIAKERQQIIMEIQAEISEKKHRGLLNKIVPVLIEGESDETDLLLSGRTIGMAPEVDGRVLVTKGRGMVGEIVPVRITEVHSYDLVGEIVSRARS
ncbi:MAG: 30S ribosomal protein S12 methylthiotransferase RimO [Deltaproteobacteria bacterium]|nr:30S ribosomal protein S12 methylthiotransferase RimO [Deltaproteobacteria bacterium]